MIRDLAAAEGPVALDADVGLVGGGTVGLLIADRLARAGLHVVVIESGSMKESESSRELNAIECTSQHYKGATEGRARGLGGTSQIWGGALIPFLPVEYEERVAAGLASWPIDVSELSPYVSELEETFGIDGGSYEGALGLELPSIAPDQDFVPRQAKWPSFSRRNVGALLGNRMRRQGSPEIWLNATVVDFNIDSSSSLLGSVVATGDGGKTLVLSAKRFVLCAGAIESTRLMLLLARKSEGDARFSTALGSYFHDHLSQVSAHLKPRDQVVVNRVFGFRFQKNTVVSQR